MLYAQAAEDTPIKQATFVPEDGIVKAQTTNTGIRKGLVDAKARLNNLLLNSSKGEVQ